jgi:hypothetical protein
MARMAAIERREAPWHLRWFYIATRTARSFSEKQLIELGAQIAFEQYRARLNPCSTSAATSRITLVHQPPMNGAGRGGGPGCRSRAR